MYRGQALQEDARRISAGKVDTIDSLASKTGIRPLPIMYRIELIRSKGNASPLWEMLEERREAESYSLARTKKQ